MQWVRLQFHWAIIDFIRHMRASMEKTERRKKAPPLCVCVMRECTAWGGPSLSPSPRNVDISKTLRRRLPGTGGIRRAPRARRAASFPFSKKAFYATRATTAGRRCAAQRGAESSYRNTLNTSMLLYRRERLRKKAHLSLSPSLSHTHGAREFVH